MPRSGLFAGEVTSAAPADDSPTSKQKGYVWMEYGATPPPYVPEGYDFDPLEGWCCTQENFAGGVRSEEHTSELQSR